MPIYEFACDSCRTVFSFLSKRIQPEHSPVCPKCGNTQLRKEITRFAMLKGAMEPKSGFGEGPEEGGPSMPDIDEGKMMKVMSELERDMGSLDENNPKHMGYMMRKLKDVMPSGMLPKEFDVAIKRLESGEDPEKIEADMGDVLGDAFGEGAGAEGMGGGGPYSKDPGLYDY